ncbi:MAG: DsbA family protein [Acidimicrobiales bacterium]
MTAVDAVDFAVTWDYRCPFARNFSEHVVVALEGGAPWNVRFIPFSLDQVRIEEGELDAWDNPSACRSLLAGQVGLVVRDRWPERFLAAHKALFACRHDQSGDLRDEAALRQALTAAGVDAEAVFAEIASGWPLDTFRKEHEAVVTDYRVFGVPTVIVGDHAVFVRVMNRPGDDVDVARRTVERALDLLVGWPQLNEFKHTTIPR